MCNFFIFQLREVISWCLRYFREIQKWILYAFLQLFLFLLCFHSVFLAVFLFYVFYFFHLVYRILITFLYLRSSWTSSDEPSNQRIIPSSYLCSRLMKVIRIIIILLTLPSLGYFEFCMSIHYHHHFLSLKCETEFPIDSSCCYQYNLDKNKILCSNDKK